jgi:hypothetical protein
LRPKVSSGTPTLVDLKPWTGRPWYVYWPKMWWNERYAQFSCTFSSAIGPVQCESRSSHTAVFAVGAAP